MVPLDEGFQQINRMTILILPVMAQAPGDPAQDMAGQMRHSHPGQDEETAVVGQSRQMAATRCRGPADEGVAGLALPGGRAKQETGYRTTVALAHQVFEILTDTVALAQVMITLKQELEQPSLRAAGGTGTTLTGRNASNSAWRGSTAWGTSAARWLRR